MAESAQGNTTIGFLDPKNPRTGIDFISRPLSTGPKSGGGRRKGAMSKLMVHHSQIYLHIAPWDHLRIA